MCDWTRFTDTALRRELATVRARFRANGGRGVDDAEFVDGASAELRRRRQARYRAGKMRRASRPYADETPILPDPAG